jgi:hypothetical protein
MVVPFSISLQLRQMTIFCACLICFSCIDLQIKVCSSLMSIRALSNFSSWIITSPSTIQSVLHIYSVLSHLGTKMDISLIVPVVSILSRWVKFYARYGGACLQCQHLGGGGRLAWGQLWLQNKFKASLSYIVRPCLKKTKAKNVAQ